MDYEHFFVCVEPDSFKLNTNRITIYHNLKFRKLQRIQKNTVRTV